MDGHAQKILDVFESKGCFLGNAFLTGSRAFGWPTEKSDWDICIHQTDMASASTVLAEITENLEESGYNSGKKGYSKRFGGEINLIPLHPLDMICWYLATQEIYRLAKAFPAVSSRLGAKETRHGYFEILRGFYKASIPYTGHEDARKVLSRIQCRDAKIRATLTTTTEGAK